MLIVSQDSFDILLSLGLETFSDNPPIWPTSYPGFSPQKVVPPHPFFREKPWGRGCPFGFFTHLYPVVPALLKNCCAGPDWEILFICHLYKAIDEKIISFLVLIFSDLRYCAATCDGSSLSAALCFSHNVFSSCLASSCTWLLLI